MKQKLEDLVRARLIQRFMEEMGDKIAATTAAAAAMEAMQTHLQQLARDLIIKRISSQIVVISFQERPKVRSAKKNYPVVLIKTAEAVDVTIRGFEIAGAWGQWSNQSEICPNGISVLGKAHVTIEDNEILCNEYGGIVLFSNSRVTIKNNNVHDNQIGIGLFDSPNAIIEGNRIHSNSAAAIRLFGSSQATIEGNKINNNDDGIVLLGLSSAKINNNIIMDNKDAGILVAYKATVEIINNIILANGGWGVTIGTKTCGYIGAKAFEGSIIGQDNVIPGPNEPRGNRGGAVCPAELMFLASRKIPW